MCITISTLHTCNCRHPITVLPCPMMDTALDLIELDGVPESDPRVQRLEAQCITKAATRYETRAHVCESCRVEIAEVGARVWWGAKEERERGVEEGWLRGLERGNDDGEVRRSRWSLGGVASGEGGAVVGEAGMAVGAMRFLRDDLLVANSSTFSMPCGKGDIIMPDHEDMLGLHNSDNDVAVDSSDLGCALRDVLGHHETVQAHENEGNICNADDEMLDMHYSVGSGLPRSAAPSPPGG